MKSLAAEFDIKVKRLALLELSGWALPAWAGGNRRGRDDVGPAGTCAGGCEVPAEPGHLRQKSQCSPAAGWRTGDDASA